MTLWRRIAIRCVVIGDSNTQGKAKMKLSIERRKQLAERIEQKIGDMLRDEGILMDGYMCREVDSVAIKLAHDAVIKKQELARTT